MSVATANGAPARDYASRYHGAGLSTIPIRGDGSKSPALNSWKQYESRLPSKTELSAMFLADNIGVAVIHGRVSGNTEVIDIDNAELFPRYWDEVDARCPGLIEKLTVVRTPRPGYHLIYKCDAIQGSQKLAQGPDPADPDKPKTLIETKGEGGYTLAPGSPGCCHETGREYEHVNGPPITELPTITTEERAALFDAARVFHAFVDEVDHDQPADAKPRHGLSPGDDYNQRATWQEILPPHGWTQLHTCGSLTHWRRPGKANGTSATTGVRSKAGNELFCCFSDNAHPFAGAKPPHVCSSYSKFAAYAVLNHGGDYSAAARALAEQGYGDRQQPSDGAGESQSSAKADNPFRRRVRCWTFAELQTAYPKLAEPVVDGIFRAGETINLIAPSKYGKSWFAYYLSLCIVTGRKLFDRFKVRPGKVLIVDNELHAATLANRIPAVAQAMGLSPHEYQDRLLFFTLRGDLRSLPELQADFEDLPPGAVDVIVLDAKYRFATEGQSENDNAAETLLYNRIDQYAARTGASFLLIHHASKGMQGGKAITDVGAGAGAQSRAADCHIVLREHEEPGVVVLDAALRSFAPIEPLPLRWEFPLWRADESVDPAKLKGNQTKGEQRQSDRDRKGFDAILAALLDGPLTERAIRKAVGMGKERAERLLDMLESQGHIESQTVDVNGNEATEYRIPESQTQGGGL